MKKTVSEVVLIVLMASILSIPISSAPSPPAIPFEVDKYTLALWHFNEGDGQIVYDESLHNNDGTLGPTSNVEARDPTWTTGFTGQPGDYALDFVDWYDHVTIPDNPDDSLDLLCGDQFTIEFWTYVRHISRPDRGDGNHWNMWIVKRMYEEPGYVITQALHFGDLYLTAFFYDGAYHTVSCQATPTYQWVHIMFTYDGQHLRLYFNDVLQTVKEIGHYYVVGNSRPLSIGKSLTSDVPWNDAIDGIIDEVRISSIARDQVVSATVDIDPDTLNLIGQGQWITAYIELPEGHRASDIDISTILLNNVISVDPDAPTEVGDYDEDGIPDVMVKFDRTAVLEWLGTVDLGADTEKSTEVVLKITGEISGVEPSPFEGSDTVKVLLKG